MKDRLYLYFLGSKPRVVILILVTATIGFVAAHNSASYLRLILTLAGIALSCAGASVLNQVIESESDAKMERTKYRALPSGKVPIAEAMAVGVLLVLSGVAILAMYVNLLTAFLSLLTSFIYVVIYTPLKRITWLNTFVGAIPGALPVLGGWTAATGEISLVGWILFMIVFLWQHPHFYAIAWIYREDYARAGLKMLPVLDPDGSRTFRQMIIYTILLIGVSFMPAVVGISGQTYFFGAAVAGIAFLASVFALTQTRGTSEAKSVVHSSIIYLPVVLGLIIVDLRF